MNLDTTAKNPSPRWNVKGRKSDTAFTSQDQAEEFEGQQCWVVA